MNAFLALNKWFGVIFGIGVGLGALYCGWNEYDKTRQEIRHQSQLYANQMINHVRNDLPPGLNGEYPADGPMAEFYRSQNIWNGSYIPVAGE